MNSDYFMRRMRSGRYRQLIISTCSICAAGLFISCFSPVQVGGFAYYTIVFLLVINSVLALLQFQQVIRPIEELLIHLCDIAGRVQANDLKHVERISTSGNDAFGCLAAGMDGVIESLIGSINTAQETANSLEEMLTALPVSLLVLTTDGKVAKIFNANGMGEAFRGFRVGEAPLEAYWGAENGKLLDQAIQSSRSKTEATWCDLTVSKLEGFGNLRFRVAVNRLNGLSALMTVVNMSDSKFTLQAERQSEQQANADNHHRAAMRHMAASIAHDGKNIFAALGNLIAANRTSSDANVREQVSVAEDTIHRGNELMRELAAFAGETHLKLACVPAADASRAVIETPAIQALIPENIRLVSHISDRKMPEVDIDTEQAWRVASNLIKNAVEAMKDAGGTIQTNVEPFTMTEEEALGFRHNGSLRMGEGVLITFADDGPGIPDSQLERLFEPYYSSKGEGRGIGLATVMTIVDAHSGAIRVRSSAGSGTTFCIFLPASRNSPEEIARMKEIAPNGEVLLVDDDQTILHTTGLVLRSLKMACHPAANGNDALARLRSLRSRIRAVLLDANIGGSCSAGLVRKIRDEFPKTPVIIVSGSPRETIESQFADVAYDRFLSKPYSITELSQALDEVAPRQ